MAWDQPVGAGREGEPPAPCLGRFDPKEGGEPSTPPSPPPPPPPPAAARLAAGAAAAACDPVCSPACDPVCTPACAAPCAAVSAAAIGGGIPSLALARLFSPHVPRRLVRRVGL